MLRLEFLLLRCGKGIRQEVPSLAGQDRRGDVQSMYLYGRAMRVTLRRTPDPGLISALRPP